MDGHPNGNPGGALKEPIILDAKPLRSLSPMFPAAYGLNHTFTPPGARPFVCVTPFGEFVSGSEDNYPPAFSPLFPTHPAPVTTSNGAAKAGKGSRSAKQSSPKTVSPLSKTDDDQVFTTVSSASGRKIKRPSHLGSYEMSSPGAEGSARKKAKLKRPKSTHEDILALPSSSHEARENVEVLLMTFDAIRRRLSQLDEVRDMGINRRPDVKAGTTLMQNDLRANSVKRIGHVPGVEVGDIFFFRIEMCLVGLHTHSIAGIDYMTVKFDDGDDPVALCIVSSGGYENVEGDVDVLIYSGQGGGGGHKEKKQLDDQKLERGNLALERSLHRANEIRVVRSVKDLSCQNSKIYIYDGIYKISESWVEKGKAGFNLFKYKLLREPGQPDGIAVWKMTQKWKENPSCRGKVILPDMSSGMENVPVCLVNEVDEEKGPSHFTYATKVNYPAPIMSKKTLQACICNNFCIAGDANCSCIRQNGGDHPFTANGLLVSCKRVVYECSASCGCSVNCRNRVTQAGVRLHFEVFRTRGRGWGLRSWDPIRAGTFICEYIGEVIDSIKVDEDEEEEEDEYVFHTMHAHGKTFKWNHGPELLGDPTIVESSESFKPLPIILSAKKMGNLSRFMNHSCSPNVFWQPVMHDHGDEGYPHFMFFALNHIPPMTELTYDYGTSGGGTGAGDETGSAARFRSLKKCLCGSSKCRGFFG